MTSIEIVELRTPIGKRIGSDPAVLSDVALVTESRAKALEFVLGATLQSEDEPYCWFVYNAKLDDPKLRPENARIIGYDGCDYQTHDDAFEAFQAMARARRVR